MPQQVSFPIERREVLGKKVARLRRQGIIPGNIYGRGRPSIPVQLNAHDFERFLATHGATTLLSLKIAGGPTETTMIRHVQHEPRTGKIEHVDFLHVELSEVLKVRVPVRLQGEAPAVRMHDGVLLHLLDTIEVEARPTDLPQAIEVDISGLEDLKSSIRVSDVRVPPAVTILTDGAETVVKVEPPRVVVEEVPAVVAPAPTVEQEAEPEAVAEGESGKE